VPLIVAADHRRRGDVHRAASDSLGVAPHLVVAPDKPRPKTLHVLARLAVMRETLRRLAEAAEGDAQTTAAAA
jgi:hypothetical protein